MTMTVRSESHSRFDILDIERGCLLSTFNIMKRLESTRYEQFDRPRVRMPCLTGLGGGYNQGSVRGGVIPLLSLSSGKVLRLLNLLV